ncbi:MAG: hypothetical protein E7235_05625 [Lachnospiraceae bacterium]|nr:hypothetical protein [Lachnospiraceae bacterium]
MKVKDMIGRVMVLFDEATGYDLVKDAYEYRYRIYDAMDSIQRELAVILSPIPAVKTISSVGGRADIGADVLRIRSLKDASGRNVCFSFGGVNEITVSDGDHELFYDRYPTRITNSSGDTAVIDEMELEISPEAQEAMVYGVCAYLLMNDEPELYNAYTGRYMSLVSNLLAARDSRPLALVRGGADI